MVATGERRGLPIIALQSLLFEKPNLRIFGDRTERVAATAYLAGIELVGSVRSVMQPIIKELSGYG